MVLDFCRERESLIEPMGDAFYTEAGKPEAGLIKDPEHAHELANLVRDRGTIAAEAREMELKRQTETGLTDEERNNLEIMAGLKVKYPDAFDAVIDSKGREFLRLRQDPSKFSDYVTQNGWMHREESRYNDNLPVSAVVDQAGKVARRESNMGTLVDLTNEDQLSHLKSLLTVVQQKEASAKEAMKARAASTVAQNVLAKL